MLSSCHEHSGAVSADSAVSHQQPLLSDRHTGRRQLLHAAVFVS